MQKCSFWKDGACASSTLILGVAELAKSFGGIWNSCGKVAESLGGFRHDRTNIWLSNNLTRFPYRIRQESRFRQNIGCTSAANNNKGAIAISSYVRKLPPTPVGGATID